MKSFEEDLTYDSSKDLWFDENGFFFVKNTFNPKSIKYIDVSGELWLYSNKHTSFIDWYKVCLPESIKEEFKYTIQEKLRSKSPSYLDGCRYLLLELSKLNLNQYYSLLDIELHDLMVIFKGISPAYQSYFREIYSNLAKNSLSSSAFVKSRKLQNIKIKRNSIESLKDVLTWNPIKGALTNEEQDNLLNALKASGCKNTKELAIKIACWLLIVTLKRGKQIRELKKDCLKVIKTEKSNEYYVAITPVKKQTGQDERWWPIPEKLYMEMISFSSRGDVKILQEKYNHFIVFDSTELIREGVISEGTLNTEIKNFVRKKLKLECTRTGEPLIVTPLRLRHSGATRLAFNGVSRDIISEMLEHDDPSSCQAYIDAIGSELCPSIKKADRNMGSLFVELKNLYFIGQIVDDVRDQPILLPEFSEIDPIPLFIGSCSRNSCKDGACDKHPFISCYNGCPNFLAWKEADHQKALSYAEKELERWRSAAINQEHLSTINEFELLKENILTVIQRIQSLKDVVYE